jgi:hypothetical protein
VTFFKKTIQMKFKFLCLAAASLSMFSGCKKDDEPVPPVVETGKGTVTLKFENYVGSQPLVLATADYPYSNANGDVFKVSLYKYYVTNIRWVNANGTEYAEPESYHLINASNSASLTFNTENVPAGTYTAVKVLLGVDSTRNVSGAQTGALDPMYGMFWAWSSGYIMAKVEGNSPQSLSAGKISFHLGGFSGQYSVLNDVTLPLPQNMVLTDKSSSTVTFKSDVLKWFASPNLVKFGELDQVNGAGEEAYKVSRNYGSSLSVTQVQN